MVKIYEKVYKEKDKQTNNSELRNEWMKDWMNEWSSEINHSKELIEVAKPYLVVRISFTESLVDWVPPLTAFPWRNAKRSRHLQGQKDSICKWRHASLPHSITHPPLLHPSAVLVLERLILNNISLRLMLCLRTSWSNIVRVLSAVPWFAISGDLGNGVYKQQLGVSREDTVRKIAPGGTVLVRVWR